MVGAKFFRHIEAEIAVIDDGNGEGTAFLQALGNDLPDEIGAGYRYGIAKLNTRAEYHRDKRTDCFS